MCFFTRISKDATELENRFDAKFEDMEDYTKSDFFVAFEYPKTPVITNEEPAKIKLFNWGLIPFWADSDGIREYTLNARIETITEKPAFRSQHKNRCLVLVDGFYEWQWQDAKGKNKHKYILVRPGGEPFALGGLWSEWTNEDSGEVLHTYTIITTPADELLSKIHNHKKRMPLVLRPDQEKDWLGGADENKFKHPEVELEAHRTD
ncbi:MAG: SOS response-associated peptidase [Candidatus Kapaibacterium sp.]